MDFKKIALRALATFVEVFVSTFTVGNLADLSASGAQLALVSAGGAVLSLIGNAAHQYLAANPE